MASGGPLGAGAAAAIRPAPDPVLRVEGLSKTYTSRRGDRTANSGIDLEVRAGEILALLGPNGAGKTTLLRQIAGQLLPSAGRITIGGIDIVRHPISAKEILSVIPQECEPKANLTVEEHVRYFALLKGADPTGIRPYVDALLERTGLASERNRLVRELSGGLRRRVLIAVALAAPNLRLLLLDEPTTGVDPEARRAVWRLVDALRAERIAVLLTTHYIEEAEYLADRVAVIDHGRIVAEGSVDAIRQRLDHRGRLEVRGLDHLSAAGRKLLDELERSYPVGFRAGNTERLKVADPFSPAASADLARLAALGIVASLAPVSLEDAYLALVGHGRSEEVT